MKPFSSIIASLALLLAFDVADTASLFAADHPPLSLRAGVAKVDITNPATPARDVPLYARAIVLGNGQTTVVLVSLDVVAIAEIGPIRGNFLADVRRQLEAELKINPANVLVNVSHCHGQVCSDVAQRTVQVVKEAWQNMVPVTVGVGSGKEDRIMENRRLRLKDGREVDVRRAYSLPPDELVAALGPVDPEIGVLRLDKKDGQPLAVAYNFACHPIEGVPGGGNTADLTGFASKVVEDNLPGGAIALFLQGCAGDVNPARYKDVDRPRDPQRLGNLLGLSTLKAVRNIQCRENAELRAVSETIQLPRADHASRIATLQVEQTRLVSSLKPTNLNLKTFIPLFVKYRSSDQFPSSPAQSYLHDEMIGHDDWNKLDADNRKSIEQYVKNIHVMEELTRVQANLALLKKNQARNAAADSKTIDVEVSGLRVGEFVLVTFPGELTVEIGLNIKKASPHKRTFVAAYTNGYIYYAPTAEQAANPGCAQEDCDCLLAPAWQTVFENCITGILRKL